MGRAYSCWMLNWWCITWPVGFKRLSIFFLFITLQVLLNIGVFLFILLKESIDYFIIFHLPCICRIHNISVANTSKFMMYFIHDVVCKIHHKHLSAAVDYLLIYYSPLMSGFIYLIVILVNNQLRAPFFFHVCFISILYTFRAATCQSSGELIV